MHQGAAQPGKELPRRKEQTDVGKAQTAPALDFEINDLKCAAAHAESSQAASGASAQGQAS